MAHILRKYISNRGSALFMVISTMTALIISCMAMYFTMVSANSAQYAVFGQMQATQTAVSLKDIVLKSLSPDNDSTGGDVLLEKMLKLNVGDCITTDANGFMALDPNKETGKNQAEIGAYSVTITCLAKDPATENMTFDILAMSSFNGSRDAVHFTFVYNPNNPMGPVGNGSGGDMELFAATGYVPNDAYISGGHYITNVFYDTQYTYMGTYEGSGENFIAQDLYAGGSVMLGDIAKSVVHENEIASITSDEIAKIGPVTWAIRGNFYPYFNANFDMRGGSQVLVGGSYYSTGEPLFSIKNSPYSGDIELDDHICIYVNGDLDWNGGYINSNNWVFVNGKVTGVSSLGGNARLFATSRADTSGISGVTIEEWPDDGEFDYGLTYNEAIALLGQKTQTISYYKWDLSGETSKSSTKHVDVRINAKNEYWNQVIGSNTVTYGPNERTFIFAYDENVSSAKYLKSKGGNENGVIGTSFVIDSLNVNSDQNNGANIIIDTGDNPDNIMTIKLSDVTGNGEFSWFVGEEWVWDPDRGSYQAKGTLTGSLNNNKRNVILVGRGTVLFDLPDGITYQDASSQFTGHIGWFLAEGGKIVMKDGHLDFVCKKWDGQYAKTIIPFIHRDCKGYYEDDKTEDGFDVNDYDGCEFSTTVSEVKCQDCLAKGTDTKLVQVTCSIHGDVNKFCPECHPEKATRSNWCVNHVDKALFEKFYNGSYESIYNGESMKIDTEGKKWITDKSGDIVYPTTNIMLVSCAESADMRFTFTKDNRNIINNEFFGFIYAPYMTYLSAGGAQAGGLIKLCGGMTVSDYDFRATHAYIGCYPDKMPTEIAGMPGGGSMAGGKLEGTAGKSWKIDIGGYA